MVFSIPPAMTAGLVEKPLPGDAPSNLAIVGRYILMPEVFDHLSRHVRGAGDEIQLTDALSAMIGSAPFHGFCFTGRRFDCGEKAGYIKANIAYALARDDLHDEIADFIGAARDQP